MDVDKKLGMSLDDLIKKTRSDRPKKTKPAAAGKKGGKKGGAVVASKKGKLGVRKALTKRNRRSDADGDTKMTARSSTQRNGAVVKKGSRRLRRVSAAGTSKKGAAASTSKSGKRDGDKKFSRRVVVKAGPNAPADIRRKIRIQNVPYDLTWKDVKEALSQVGKIERCDVDHGEATLLFSSHKEAMRAIQTYNGGDMNGRKIRVSFA